MEEESQREEEIVPQRIFHNHFNTSSALVAEAIVEMVKLMKHLVFDLAGFEAYQDYNVVKYNYYRGDLDHLRLMDAISKMPLTDPDE